MGVISKINTTDALGTTGVNYLFDSIEQNGIEYDIPDGTYFNGGSWTPPGASAPVTLDECTYKQRVTTLDNIDDTFLSSEIFLEENSPYKHETFTHYYYDYDFGENAFVRTNYCTYVPGFLQGWRYLDTINNTWETLPEGENVGTSGIVPVLDDNNGNIDAYANWGDPCLIRVVMYITDFSNIPGYMPDADITITNTGLSYTATANDMHPLTDNFKTIYHTRDNGIDEPFCSPNIDYGTSEYGGVLKHINGNKHVTYFAVKPGLQACGVSISNIVATKGSESHTGWFRPLYVNTGHGVSLPSCRTIEYLCKNNSPTTVNQMTTQTLSYSNGTYTYTPSTNLSTDMTVFVQLIRVDYTIKAVPQGGSESTDSTMGYVKITSVLNPDLAWSSRLQNAKFLEGETFTISAIPNTSGVNTYAFDHWEDWNGNNVGSDPTLTLVGNSDLMNTPRTYTAMFTQTSATQYKFIYHKMRVV